MFTLIFIISLLSFSIGMSFILGGWFIPLWIVTGWFVGYFVVILFIIFFTYVTLPLPITSKFKNYIWRSASWIVNRLVFNLWLSVEGIEKIPMDGKLVIYSNHKSYLDPVILMQIIKRPFAPHRNHPSLRYLFLKISWSPWVVCQSIVVMIERLQKVW